MKGKEFFELEKNGKTFVLTLQADVNGFKRNDILICRKDSEPLLGSAIAILERDDCGRWPIRYDLAEAEIAAGAKLIGQALSMSRDLDRGVEV